MTKLDHKTGDYSMPLDHFRMIPIYSACIEEMLTLGVVGNDGRFTIKWQTYKDIYFKHYPEHKRFEKKETHRRLPPGYIMAHIIKVITGDEKACGTCSLRANMMNAWGWWRCWKERETIINWLVEAAANRGHVIDRNRAMSLFRAALKEGLRLKLKGRDADVGNSRGATGDSSQSQVDPDGGRKS